MVSKKNYSEEVANISNKSRNRLIMSKYKLTAISIAVDHDVSPCPASILVCNKIGFSDLLKSLNLATHFAGSQYWTWESWYPAVANMYGYFFSEILSYGE